MILIICRRIEDLKLIKKVNLRENTKFIVASDLIEVHRKAKSDFSVVNVTFIEQMESLFSVADDVLKIREKVNEWLLQQGPDIPPYLLKWIKWTEGGSTTQKIQDALLLINSYKSLFFKYKVDKVFLYRRVETYWEDEILLAIARSMGIASKEFKNLFFALYRIFNINIVKRKILGRKYLTFYIPEFLLIRLKQINLFVRILHCKFTRHNCRRKADAKEVTFLLGSSADKHVDNTAIVMEEFAKREGYIPIALCWNAVSGCKKIKIKGLKARNLENWFPLRKTYRVFINYWQTKSSSLKHSKEFKDQDFIKYNNVPLGGILWPYIIKFVKVELLFRLFLFHSSRNYLKSNNPVAVKTWGENVLNFGLVFNKVLKEKSHKKKLKRPIVFHCPVGLTAKNPYCDSTDKPDLLFVSGEIDKDISLAYLNNNTNVIVSGFGQNTKIINFRRKYDYEDSKNILRISELLDYNIFYVPSGILRGYISLREHIELAVSLIEFILIHENISIIIKPHPSEDEFFWHDLLAKYGKLSNVHLIDKNQSPYHCINICDFIITKFSTLALEAMEFEKPVISVVLDGEKKFLNIFEDGVEKFTDLKSLILFLENIFSERKRYDLWKRERIVAQNKFLPRKMYKPEEQVEKIIVDAIINYRKERYE